MILAEALLLIAFDDEKGKDSTWVGIDSGLAGALLLDLAADGFVNDVDGKLEPSAQPPEHPTLRAALEAIAADDKRRKPEAWVERLPGKVKPIQQRVAGPLVEAGVLEEERRKRLGLFETVRYPARDPAPERELREGLRAVLVDGHEPSRDQALLLSLLEPFDLVKHLVDKDERKAAKARAKDLAQRTPESKAVKAAVEGVQVALMLVATSSAAASSANSS